MEDGGWISSESQGNHPCATAIAAKQLERAGVKLRPGETLQYIITNAEADLPDDRVRAWTLWERWQAYDVKIYQKAVREAFEAFDHFALVR